VPDPRYGHFVPGTPVAKRALARVVAYANRALDAVPPLRALYARTLRRLAVREVAVALDCHPDLDGLRIAWVSDVHVGSYLDDDGLRFVFEKVAAARADLVCLGGDLIHTRPREMEPYADVLPLLRPPLGTFAVPGNHEHFWTVDPAAWRAFMAARGVGVLWNRGTRIERGRGSLWLAGVDDLAEGEPDLAAALHGRRGGELTVLLSHHPDLFPAAAAQGVDVTLSGHTHGGQVRVFGFTPMKNTRLGFVSGRHERGGRQLFVGCGVGASILPLRIGVPPEVPVYRLTRR
jgi:predicted MPP superfamily phosphohydrolase